MFQFGQEERSFLLGSGSPHDLATPNRLTLAEWESGHTIWQQIICSEWSRVRRVCVQCGNQCRPVLHDADARVTMPMNPPLMTLGEAKPAFEIEIVPDLLELALTDEEAGQEADHDRGHVPANRILGLLEAIDQRLELLLATRTARRTGFEDRGYFLEVL